MIRERTLARVRAIMASRPCDFMVGEPDNPYMKRWRTTSKRWAWLFAIYAHEFYHDDDDVPHDHPYLFCLSWILFSGYWECSFRKGSRDYREGLDKKLLWVGDWYFRWGWTPHRVELTGGSERPITIFFCGPRVRNWGFHCPKFWRPYQEYIAPTSYGNRIGKGCSE